MSGMTQVGSPPAAASIQRGDNLDLPVAPAGGYASGEMVIVAGLLGVVNVGVPEGHAAAASIKGVYGIANSGITPVAGTQVAVNIVNQNAVATTTGGIEAGVVVEDVADAADPVKVLINQAAL